MEYTLSSDDDFLTKEELFLFHLIIAVVCSQTNSSYLIYSPYYPERLEKKQELTMILEDKLDVFGVIAI